MKRTSAVPFNGTQAQETELREWLRENKNVKGVNMLALQKAQEIYSYLPIEVQTMIAEELNVSLEEIYGISTFYAMFRLEPVGKYQISVCLGTACYVKGSDKVLEKIKSVLKIEEGHTTPDGKFSLETCRCVGACGLAPVMMINGEVYGRLTGDEVEEILSKYN